MSGTVGIRLRKSTGPIETPWGSELRRIEERIREADDAGMIARWESGRHLLKKREGKQLPRGLLDEAAEALGVTRRELQWRMKLADLCPTEAEVRNAFHTYGSWRRVIADLLTQTRRSPAKKGGPSLFIRRTYRELPKLHATDLADSDLEALRAIRDEIDRIFAEID